MTADWCSTGLARKLPFMKSRLQPDRHMEASAVDVNLLLPRAAPNQLFTNDRMWPFIIGFYRSPYDS